jgi:23S rRNA pseudouridine2605 synthase
MRLGKYLATAGVASRRASEEIIRVGRVTVGGQLVTDPARDVTADDDVRLDGARLAAGAERQVFLVHKPPGVVSTAHDPQRRRTIVSLVPSKARLYPVGRLDIDTTGLILLTDDGDLAHRLTHPSFEVPRTYRVQVTNPPITDRTLRRLREGVRLEDGMTAPARVRRLGGRDSNQLELTLHEGRNRQVKRMCEAVGHRVVRLQRVAFGPLTLGDLPAGAHRRLTAAEVEALHRAGSTGSRRPPPGRAGDPARVIGPGRARPG